MCFSRDTNGCNRLRKKCGCARPGPTNPHPLCLQAAAGPEFVPPWRSWSKRRPRDRAGLVVGTSTVEDQMETRWKRASSHRNELRWPARPLSQLRTRRDVSIAERMQKSEGWCNPTLSTHSISVHPMLISHSPPPPCWPQHHQKVIVISTTKSAIIDGISYLHANIKQTSTLHSCWSCQRSLCNPPRRGATEKEGQQQAKLHGFSTPNATSDFIHSGPRELRPRGRSDPLRLIPHSRAHCCQIGHIHTRMDSQTEKVNV